MIKRFIFHIDANSAYLSWSVVKKLQEGYPLDLRTVPSIVGGDPATRHGIVLAKSIPAKKYSIQTGETVFEAKAKCPNLIIIPPDYSLYMQCHKAFGDVLREYSPLVEAYSVDEFFMDFTGMEKLYPDPIEAAYMIKERIKNELGFTVNIGISTNKLLAKMASELKKPDMVHTIFPEEISTKMWPLPIEELFGVGRRTAPKLRDRGIKTIGDLANCKPEYLKLFLKSYGILLWNYANGREDSPVRTDRKLIMKGIGNSTTIPFDVEDSRTAHLVLLSLVENVAMRLRQAECLTQLVSVSIRTKDFYFYSHQRKLFSPTDSTNEIYHIACELFNEAWKEEPVRHLGVRVSELCSNTLVQMTIFDRDVEKQRAVDRAVDSIRFRFGNSAVKRAAFLNSGLRFMTGGTVTDEEYPVMSSIL